MRFGEEGSKRSKIAQNYSLMSSSVVASVCPAGPSFFSFLHTAPCSSPPTAGSTDQEMGQLTHRGKSFQRLLQLLIPIPLLLLDEPGFSDQMVSNQPCIKFQLLHILVSTWNVSLLNFSHVNWIIKVSNCCFNLCV